MRVIALLAAHNEERFIAGSLCHLISQGISVYLCDNESTDGTVAIAERFIGRGLLGIETIPRAGHFDSRAIMVRKEALVQTLDADWFMHVDTDEVHMPPRPGVTLAEALTEVEAQGYNAVNSYELTLLPTREAPDHDHPDFQRTMRWYYPFVPKVPWLLRAWRRSAGPVELAWSGGHLVRFPDLRIHPVCFGMRHYLFLSIPHAIRKYGHRRYNPDEVRDGWHGWRHQIRPELRSEIAASVLPSQSDLRPYVSDAELDASDPLLRHEWAERLAALTSRPAQA